MNALAAFAVSMKNQSAAYKKKSFNFLIVDPFDKSYDPSCWFIYIWLHQAAKWGFEPRWKTVNNSVEEWTAGLWKEAKCLIPDGGLAALRMNLRQNSTWLLLLQSVFPHKISLLLHRVEVNVLNFKHRQPFQRR